MFTLLVPPELADGGHCRPTGQFEHIDFFPVDGAGVSAAKAICNGATVHGICPVREQCLEYALVHRIDHGVWGGESERSRRLMVKKRRAVLERPERVKEIGVAESTLRAHEARVAAQAAEQAEIEAEMFRESQEQVVQIRRELAG